MGSNLTRVLVLAALWSVVGCTASTSDTVSPEGGSSDAEETGGHGTKKMSAGLKLRFEEPKAVAVNQELAFALVINGRPSETLTVQLRGSEGTSVSKDAAEVQLDASGSGRVEFRASVERPKGCLVIANVSTPSGRSQELHCVVGGADPAEERKGVKEMGDGRKLRVDRAK
ncbi:MAG: hypothetical protein AAF488_17635 [Planctomycetota bacterium]